MTPKELDDAVASTVAMLVFASVVLVGAVGAGLVHGAARRACIIGAVITITLMALLMLAALWVVPFL